MASGGRSLYADLLEPSSTTKSTSTISAAPIVFSEANSKDTSDPNAAKKQISSAALRFQPLQKRPQQAQPKNAKKGAGVGGVASFIKIAKADATTDDPNKADEITQIAAAARAPAVKSTLEDWTGNADDDDVNGFYGSGNKQQRGGRKRRKKNKEKEEKVYHNWDDIYDPSRPNSYEEYRESEEKEQEMRDWRDRLYDRRRAFSSDEDDEEDNRRGLGGMNQFAPPSSYSFAPPPLDPPAPKAQPVEVPDDPTGEDAYARRLRLSQQVQFAPPAQHTFAPPPPPPPPPPAPPAPPATAPIVQSTISRAPIRYTLPAAPTDLSTDDAVESSPEPEPEPEEDIPRSSRPGQAGFAERLMSKYGWTKGTGLGADSSGIVQPLHVKVSKGKEKKPGTGQIIDRNKKRAEEQEGKFGKMSEVVILKRMVDGLEDEDMAVLMQEIGDECGEKYGRIERVYIQHRQSEEVASKVFVQFTSQLSALRAVNALEGRIFNGNTIEARFFDAKKFERRELEN